MKDSNHSYHPAAGQTKTSEKTEKKLTGSSGSSQNNRTSTVERRLKQATGAKGGPHD